MTRLYCLLILLSIFPFCSYAQEKKPITIGGIFCLTGEIASGCNAIREGAEIGLDLVNKEGGINGQPLKLDIQDSHYTPKGSHSLAVRFAGKQNVLGILITGIVETKAAAAPLEKASLPYLTLWDSAPSIEALGDYSFGIGPWLPSTYEVSAEFAFNKLNKKRAAVISTNAEWSLSVSKGFEKHFKKLGGKVLIAESTLPDDPNFRSVLLRVLRTKPDVIYAPITSNMIPFFRQLKELGYQGEIVTSDNLTEEIISQGRGVFEGAYQTMVGDPETEEAKKLAQLYKEKFSKDPPMLVFHGWGYDGVRLMAEGLRNSKLTRKSLRESLLSIKNFPGAGGSITFSEQGSWRMPLSIFKVESGKFVKL